ncbi:Twin-arginine translocation pathway signal sequence domain protein [Sulfitobacter noctilucicola]|uniref:DUF1513 domain-containing protein n=1 Tax=Sulfitobacter noctilucicola TaxID=1342301 RepID=A0A7W6M8D8_9RHOB|nr:DUF1513 domain-containing protein [Sulfitobacter noctilucicola]KIN64655.1 Twin-arginine translocation pathway signal sequence domain protein [Sulfitobacter noctilucicola]MBB4174196.1 hypothetical protein [Sulfitobacter noctilucicola]
MTATDRGRRAFLGGLLAAGAVPRITWADAGAPAFLSAAARPDGNYVLCGIGEDLKIRFERPLPARGHAAAAHPVRPEAVAFARRPGTFAVVLDCATGDQKAKLTAPAGRHFYGHGAFSQDGRLLFTTENNFEAGRGCIGVWETSPGYRRIAEWDSGGVGPHDIRRLPDSDTLVVANGGIDTHPDTGRTKLNIPTMAPNLAYIEDGEVVETAALPARLHKNSIRHLDLDAHGTVAFGMQWQGSGPVDVLVGTHTRGSAPKLMTADPGVLRDMDGYIGSIAFSGNGKQIAVTSPRGGVLQLYEVETSALAQVVAFEDVCGVATVGGRFVATSGTGQVRSLGRTQAKTAEVVGLAWDNHLVRL